MSDPNANPRLKLASTTALSPLEIDLGQAGRIAGGSRPEAYGAPAAWTPEHVDVRLTEAFEILLTLPIRIGPAAMKSLMPAFAYSKEDLEGQREGGGADVIRAHKRLTRARGTATIAEISRMEAALGWPLAYLRHDSAIAKAVTRSSFLKAVKREEKKTHHELGVSRRTFFRYRLKGLQIIAGGLNLSGTPVA